MIDGVILDIAGVLAEDGRAVAGSLQAVAALRASGRPVCFATNTSRRPRRAVITTLRELGYELEPDEVMTAPQAIRRLLEEQGLRPLLLIDPALVVDFDGVDTTEPDAVVVCDAGDGFTYAALNEAFRVLIGGGALLLAVGDNRYYRSDGELMLDAGPFIRALEYAADVEARMVGKPAVDFFHAAAAVLGCRPDHVLMVGDDVGADVNGAIDAGLQAALVRTGKYRDGDESQMRAGAVVADDLAALLEDLALV